VPETTDLILWALGYKFIRIASRRPRRRVNVLPRSPVRICVRSRLNKLYNIIHYSYECYDTLWVPAHTPIKTGHYERDFVINVSAILPSALPNNYYRRIALALLSILWMEGWVCNEDNDRDRRGQRSRSKVLKKTTALSIVDQLFKSCAVCIFFRR